MKTLIADVQWLALSIPGRGGCVCRYIHTVDGVGYRRRDSQCRVHGSADVAEDEKCCYRVALTSGHSGSAADRHCPVADTAHHGATWRPQRNTL